MGVAQTELRAKLMFNRVYKILYIQFSPWYSIVAGIIITNAVATLNAKENGITSNLIKIFYLGYCCTKAIKTIAPEH